MSTTAYLTLAQLQAMMAEPRLEDCLDDNGDGSLSGAEEALATDTDTGVIYRAGAEADAYLASGGYTIPLTSGQITPALRHHVGMLAAHRAAQRRPQFRDAQGRAPYWQEAAEARAFFVLVRDGKVSLAGAPSASLPTDGTGGAFVTHARRGGERVTSAANPYRQRRW